MNKTIIVNTLKEVLRRALLPNVILVPFIIFLHWTVVSIWLYYNYDHVDFRHKIILVGLGGGLPVLTYNLWGLRRFLIRAYLVIHNNIIQIWLHPYCKKMADHIIQSDLMNELEANRSSLVVEWIDYLKEKSQQLPTILRKIVQVVIRKIGYSNELDEKIRLLSNKNSDEIANVMNREIANRLIAASNQIVPAYIIYLIPINIILMILLWFI